MPQITASLLSGLTPEPVQLIVTGVPQGEEFVVRGRAGDVTWDVPGGRRTAPDGQVVLIDVRAPINLPVVYELTHGQQVVTSDPVQVRWQPDGAYRRALVQSLDGRTVIPVRMWIHNGLPRDPHVGSVAFRVEGRSRPVVVMRPAGDGTTTFRLLLTREAGEALTRVMRAGGGIAVRTDGSVRDLPATDLGVVLGWPSELWDGDGGLSTSRVYTLTVQWIDDPEPDVPVALYTWDDFDHMWSASTWDDFDRFFAGRTWADFDALDYGQYGVIGQVPDA
ncbi:hypothetical protein DNL40_02290 [Xylanimonas oleitrophica]|uniref:Uncharacterized protein n=1 Tax=Xylanimonas oleitrophica TaxID=2607479 RepID=A0A2W5WUR5_9MICO|nr:hypothetical protein [Xylanimonas oleitrophica]PZR55219.1 hypothetical protein DNL40_02290 [Xylanimonas oleitrophica]